MRLSRCCLPRALCPPWSRPQVVVDPNVFRRARLYTPEMEVAVVQHLEIITATFKLYKVGAGASVCFSMSAHNEVWGERLQTAGRHGCTAA